SLATAADPARCNAGSDILADARCIQHEWWHRGVARRGYRGNAASGDRKAISWSGPRGAPGFRAPGQRTAAAAADRLGDRAAEGAVRLIRASKRPDAVMRSRRAPF